MTTIAVKDGVVAADSLMTFGHERSLLPVWKILATDAFVYAASGIAILDALARWHEDGHDPRQLPVVAAGEKWSLLVMDEGAIWLYGSEAPYPQPVQAPFSLGTGGELALGAMLAGASAVEAVEIACRVSTSSGLPVYSVNIAEALSGRGLA
jgi:ATP-dependent protease HslVU (ClpYQ) peptidase subunit